MVGATTPREKLKAIHDYVRTNIRYIAEEDDYGAIVPRSPDLVLQRGYGDCKDRAYLISALAAEEGINVDMTLVATNPTPTFANSTYIHQYNHVICSWNDGTKRVYFDPTSKYTEFDNLPYSDVESTALVLDPKNPQMVRLPRPNQNAAIEVELRGNLSDPENVRALWQRWEHLPRLVQFGLFILAIHVIGAPFVVWPGFWRWSAGTQLRIFFLHNFLLGWVSSALLGVVLALCVQRVRRIERAMNVIWMGGVAVMLLALLGVGFIQFLPVHAATLLWVAAWSSIAPGLVALWALGQLLMQPGILTQLKRNRWRLGSAV